jgi:hypothetical protein
VNSHFSVSTSQQIENDIQSQKEKTLAWVLHMQEPYQQNILNENDYQYQ